MEYGTSNEVNRKEFDLGKESRKSTLGKETCKGRMAPKGQKGQEIDCQCEEEQPDLVLRKHLEHTHSVN